MAITRNTITTVEQLINGDRFYYVKDKGKKVYEYNFLPDYTKHHSRPFALVARVMGNGLIGKDGNVRAYIDEQVVFLRNTSDKYAEDIRKITDRQENKGNTDQVL